MSSCESYECADFMDMTYFRQPAEMCYTIDMYQKSKPKDHPLNVCATLWNYGELSSSIEELEENN